jgi:hypothetical protein
MPLTKAARAEYPAGWFDPGERERLLRRAGYQCECRGECGVEHSILDPITNEPLLRAVRCQQRDGELGEVLTRAHLCQDPTCSECCQNYEHIKVYCRRCHLSYDNRQARRALRIRKKAERRGQSRLFPEAT